MKTIRFNSSELIWMASALRLMETAPFEGGMHQELCKALAPGIYDRVMRAYNKLQSRGAYDWKLSIKPQDASVISLALISLDTPHAQTAMMKVQPMLVYPKPKPLTPSA